MQRATEKAISPVTRQHTFGRTREPDGPELFAVMEGAPSCEALDEANLILHSCEALAIDLTETEDKAYALWQLIRLARALVNSVDLNGINQCAALGELEGAHGRQ